MMATSDVVVRWDDDSQRMIVVQINGTWDFQALLRQVIPRIGALLEESEQPAIGLAIDHTHANVVNITAGFPYLVNKGFGGDPRLVISVQIGLDDFRKRLIRIFSQVYPPVAKKLATANTLGEARALISSACAEASQV
jgi:hypothetical protein